MLVSVIIPALNEAEHITNCIRCARDGPTDDDLDLVVVDGGSTDGTRTLVPDDAHIIETAPGRARQLNAGAKASRGEVLVFCHADTYLPHGWRQAVLDRLAQENVVAGAFFARLEPARGILRLVNHVGLPTDWRFMFGDQAQFMTRTIYDRVGGYPELPLMEDVEMMRNLHQLGRLVRVPKHLRVITSSRRFLERGVLRQTLLDGWNLFRYLYLGISAEVIASSYCSSREEIVRHG
jgi:rSAM/selenodomain-associated transferase 2